MMARAASATFRRSARAGSLELSEIVRISEKARAMRAAGEDVLSFGTGEPDFPTPPHVIEQTCAAMRQGAIRYPPTQGLPELRQAICDDAGAQTGFSANPAEVIVSTGAKQVLFNAFLATLDPGDEVILPAPYWTNYADIVGLVGGKAVRVDCGAELTLTPGRLRSAITPKTRWLVLNSPGNPSGKVYSRAELEALAEVLREFAQVWVMADEIYQHISYEPFCSFRVAAPGLSDRTLIVNGVSKSYAMIGWRIGWGIGPVELIRAMVAVQGQSTSPASVVSQIAACAALSGPQELLGERCESFRRRRDLVVSAINAIEAVSCRVPGGAFYIFPDCRATYGLSAPDGTTIADDSDYCGYILDSARVAIVPGRTFGLGGHFRLSYAYAEDDLVEGCRRIEAATAALAPC